MSLTLLFNRTKPKLEAIELDASLRESHVSNQSGTQNPIEEGSKVTDHLHDEPEQLSIVGVISEQPDVLAASLDPRVGGAGRHKDAYQALQELKRRREPFDVFTSLRSLPNMRIKRLTVIRTARTTNALEFTADLEEILIASVSLVENIAGAIADLGLKEVDFGSQGTGPV